MFYTASLVLINESWAFMHPSIIIVTFGKLVVLFQYFLGRGWKLCQSKANQYRERYSEQYIQYYLHSNTILHFIFPNRYKQVQEDTLCPQNEDKNILEMKKIG